MDARNPDCLMLIPNGYPVWIDVPQASVGGTATAMRFVLPVRAHNLPLLHRKETKLVVALSGELEIRTGDGQIAFLGHGDALRLEAGTAHRIHQYGEASSTVGVVLWPGGVEQAFREIADAARQVPFLRSDMVEILDRYDVVWTVSFKPPQAESERLFGTAFPGWLRELPREAAALLQSRWGEAYALGSA
ncbi:cupin domain-containing protein [Pseudomonas abietaniphila]|uniref:cupin domain-containing protein n=1 Tax=Pseudomonas abietaniphila TaxID=89065 RepID=UPI0032175325